VLVGARRPYARLLANVKRRSRIAENIDVFDLELSSEEMAAIDDLDTGRRGGPEPDAITLEEFGREIPEA
jgi:diketogulonate reductase-like aldo/keto reductase